MIYSGKLSVKENARRNKVSEATVRRYIRDHHLDRRGDEAIARQQEIRRLHQKGATVQEIAKQTGYARNTIYKYLRMSEDICTRKGKTSSLLNGSNDSLISSHNSSQLQILRDIISLYVSSCQIDCDLTFSKGGFYHKMQRPKECYDIQPLYDFVQPLDMVKSKQNCYQSVVIDLPFYVDKGARYSMSERYGKFDSVEELQDTYTAMLQLAKQLLVSNGVLIMKVQDTSYNHKPIWIHTLVEQTAKELDLQMEDVLIHTEKSVPTMAHYTIQRHARKQHSYFYVFRKS